MKMCSKCKVEKETKLFGKSSRSKDGFHSWCKSCVSKARMRRYYENREEERKRGNQRNRDAKAKNRDMVWEYLSTHPCVDCGESDVRVLEFDHVRGTKIASVSELVNTKHRWESIQQEIDKCEVRCANHHRIRTYEQFGWRTPLDD